MTNNRHTSKTDDWRTPKYIIEPAREWLGGEIIMDPATSYEANLVVGARTFHDIESNGFLHSWDEADVPSTVFLNPPGGRCDERGVRWYKGCGRKSQPAAKAWWFKLAREWAEGRVRSAVFLGFSVEILQTTQVATPDGLFTPLDGLLCFPRTRVAFTDPMGKPVKGNTHASVIVGLPDRNDQNAHGRWVECFSKIGKCR